MVPNRLLAMGKAAIFHVREVEGRSSRGKHPPFESRPPPGGRRWLFDPHQLAGGLQILNALSQRVITHAEFLSRKTSVRWFDRSEPHQNWPKSSLVGPDARSTHPTICLAPPATERGTRRRNARCCITARRPSAAEAARATRPTALSYWPTRRPAPRNGPHRGRSFSVRPTLLRWLRAWRPAKSRPAG